MANKYLHPFPINSNTWFYKNPRSFEFHLDTPSGHVQFTVQDRTLKSFINHKAKDVKRIRP